MRLRLVADERKNLIRSRLHHGSRGSSNAASRIYPHYCDVRALERISTALDGNLPRCLEDGTIRLWQGPGDNHRVVATNARLQLIELHGCSGDLSPSKRATE